MSDTQRPKSIGDELSAEEVNQDLPTVETAGETISGATLPVACFLDIGDGEWYACDGNDDTKLEFEGFAVSDGTDGNNIVIQNHGVVSGFSGLSAGEKYYIQDDKTIGTTAGTYEILVGIAISATEILIIKERGCRLLASDVLQASSDSVVTDNSGSWVEKKSFQVKCDGTIRVKFDIRNDLEGPESKSGRIYINDVGIGTIQSNSGTWVTYSQDITVKAGDDVQLWVNDNGTANQVQARNYRIYFDTKRDNSIIN